MAQSRAARRPAARPRTLRAARACCRPRPRAFAWLDRSLLAVCVLSGCFFFFLAKKNHTPHPACTHTYTHFATLKYDTMLPRIKWALYASTVLMSHMSCAVFDRWRFWGSIAQPSGVVIHIFNVPLTDPETDHGRCEGAHAPATQHPQHGNRGTAAPAGATAGDATGTAAGAAAAPAPAPATPPAPQILLQWGSPPRKEDIQSNTETSPMKEVLEGWVTTAPRWRGATPKTGQGTAAAATPAPTTAAEEGTGGRGQEREVWRRLTVAPHLEPPTPAARSEIPFTSRRLSAASPSNLVVVTLLVRFLRNVGK
jgi:hypothetical protein